MNTPGSLCPSMKAAEIVGDKWTLLILRELFLGSTRYNDFQRALPRISPTILSKRLKQLEKNGLIVHKKTVGGKGGEYRLTRSGRELAPIVDSLARWGLRWARDQLCEVDLDAGGFMWDFHRTLRCDELPDGETVFCVIFNDQDRQSKWWMVAKDGVVDLCNDDPGRDVDLYITGKLADVATVWRGDIGIVSALDDKAVVLSGAGHLTKYPDRWFPKSIYSEVVLEEIKRAEEG